MVGSRNMLWFLLGVFFDLCGASEYDPSAYGVADGQAAETLLVAVEPDSYFIWQNSTAMFMFGTELILKDFMWKQELDLVVHATTVTLPAEMFFRYRKEVRTVHIQSQKIHTPPLGTKIDVCGQDGDAGGNGIPANMGAPDQGKSGDDGVRGDPGIRGGKVFIEFGNLTGGGFNILAKGGNGGRGQDGGDGGRGRTGTPNNDLDACCNGRSTKGKPGGAGGNGGGAGKGGRGGQSGVVRVLYSSALADNAKIDVNNEPGNGGEPGRAGKGGTAGLGGPGSPKTCVKLGFLFKDKRCFLPLGQPGDVGNDGADGGNGAAGQSGRQEPPDVREVDLVELRKNECSWQMDFDLRTAAILYRAGDLTRAQAIYEWVRAVKTANSKHCKKVKSSGEYDFENAGSQAEMYLQQLSMGVNYWGDAVGQTPLRPFDEIYDHVQGLFLTAGEVDRFYQIMEARFLGEDDRDNSIAEALVLMENQIKSMENDLSRISDDINEALAEKKTKDQERETLLKQMTLSGEKCDAAIRKKSADEIYAWEPSWGRVVDFLKKTVPNVISQFTILMGIVKVAQAFVTDSGNSALGLVTDASNLGGSSLNQLQDFAVIGAIPLITTIITQAKTVTQSVTQSVKDTGNTLQEIGNQWNAGSHMMDENVRMYREDRHESAILDWLADLDDCQDNIAELKDIIRVSNSYDKLVSSYDKNVLSYSKKLLEIEELKLKKTRASNAAAGTFDPTARSLTFMISNAFLKMKDEIMEALKDLHSAMNYEFCTSEFLAEEGVTMDSLRATFTQIMAARNRKQTVERLSRTVIADFPDFEAPGVQIKAVTVIELKQADMVNAFENFYETGKLIYTLPLDHSSLPIGCANMRIVSVQAKMTGLINSVVTSHIKREAVSQCIGTDGETRTFLHKPLTYLSQYNQGDGTSPPRWLTGSMKPGSDAPSAPGPSGTYEISLPQTSTREEREVISSVELHLVISCVPCATPTCENGARAQALMI